MPDTPENQKDKDLEKQDEAKNNSSFVGRNLKSIEIIIALGAFAGLIATCTTYYNNIDNKIDNYFKQSSTDINALKGDVKEMNKDVLELKGAANNLLEIYRNGFLTSTTSKKK